MVSRVLNILQSNSFFLFGARGTGKTTLLERNFSDKSSILIDLLLPKEFDQLSKNPQLLLSRLDILPNEIEWVIIDEIQKIPQLLDIVHHQIEHSKRKFALTGSSARKLKRGAANLLAGRAFVYNLFPLTFKELGELFDLSLVLQFGTLPKLLEFELVEEKARFIESYARTYVQEEVWNEHLIRKLVPFRRFLDVAAQMNGEILNYSKIADDVGVDDNTVREYFDILEDTLLGFRLEAHHRSVRKRQRYNPKFYFFDCGVNRAIRGLASIPIIPGSSEYGDAFEHFLILEMHRNNSYCNRNYTFSYLRTKDGAEVDLIIERPNAPSVLIEIKSSTSVTERDATTLQQFLPDFSDAEAYILSNDAQAKRFNKVKALHWKVGLSEIGLH